MKIGIMSRGPNNPSTLHLFEAGQSRGHEMSLINPMTCYMKLTPHHPEVFKTPRQALVPFDAIIPRIGTSSTFYASAILRQFEFMGVYCVNNAVAIGQARDKLRALQLLGRKGIGLPITAFAHQADNISHILKLVGGAPVIIKILDGTQGVGVVFAETAKAAESVIQAFKGLDTHILVQEFIQESRGRDIRCLVLGHKVIAAVQRHGAPGEFRSNVHRGGYAEKVKITPEERATAVAATKAMGLNLAGVDILRSHRGPLVLEVNSSPGIAGMAETTECDLAGHIIEWLEKQLTSKSPTP